MSHAKNQKKERDKEVDGTQLILLDELVSSDEDIAIASKKQKQASVKAQGGDSLQNVSNSKQEKFAKGGNDNLKNVVKDTGNMHVGDAGDAMQHAKNSKQKKN